MKYDKIVKIIAGLCFIIAGVFFVLARSGKEEVVISSNETTLAQIASSKEIETATANVICVHVCGAVKKPGVFELESGSRISDAIKLAGGFSNLADKNALNLAEILSDGMQVRVPKKGEATAYSRDGPFGVNSNGVININTASVSELITLPGIGQSKAQAIITYRTEHGAFAEKEELKNVSGIGDATYEKLKDRIDTG